MDGPDPECSDGFHHEALIYSGDDGLVTGVVAFVEDGQAAGEAVLVALSAEHAKLIRDALGSQDDVTFVDMTELGQNPARVIPAWRDFVDTASAEGRRVRGVSQPMWMGRSEVELVECQRHEALLNVAFGNSSSWRLLCPYDAEHLDSTIIDEALRSHPLIFADGEHLPNPVRTPDEFGRAHLAEPLPEPGDPTYAMSFGPADLRDVRDYVAAHAIDSGMPAERAFDLLVAVSEIATNSIKHGGGTGVLRVWHDRESVICEFTDAGELADPLAGRIRPAPDSEGERGLWLANQLCDLVQTRVYDSRTVIRLHKRVGR